jgi:hypothetical protein
VNCSLLRWKFEGLSKRAVELGEFERWESGNEMRQLTFKHQREKVTADRAGPRQAVFRPENDFCAQTENLTVNRSADHSRNIIMFCDKGSGYNDVKTWFCSPLGYPFAGPVNLPSPHERACSEMSARACRARLLRCFRNISLSLLSVTRRRSRSAYWRTAVRTSAERLHLRRDVWVSSSRSLEVASSIMIVFME